MSLGLQVPCIVRMSACLVCLLVCRFLVLFVCQLAWYVSWLAGSLYYVCACCVIMSLSLWALCIVRAYVSLTAVEIYDSYVS